MTVITTRVIVDGVECPAIGDVLPTGQATVAGGPQLTWGRDTIVDQPQPSTVALTFEQRVVAGSGFPTLFDFLNDGSVVQIRSTDGVRDVLVWAGEIVTAQVQVAGRNLLSAQANCVDGSALLANVTVGDEPWPEESAYARFRHILDAAGVKVQALRPSFDPGGTGSPTWVWALTGIMDDTLHAPMVTFRDIDAQPPLALIQELADSIGGVVWVTADDAGPYIRIEDPTQRRGLREFFIDASTGTITIGPIDPALSVQAQTWSAEEVLQQPIQWAKDPAQSVNLVDVNWQQFTGHDDSGNRTYTQRAVEHTYTDSKSIRALTRDTILADDADANLLAVHLLAQSSTTPWIITGLTIDTIILRHSLTGVPDADRITRILDLLDCQIRLGYRITINNLPDYSPSGTTQSFYVDGGTYTWSGGRWQMALNASANAIGGGAKFDQFPPGVKIKDFTGLRGRDVWGVAPPNLSTPVVPFTIPVMI